MKIFSADAGLTTAHKNNWRSIEAVPDSAKPDAVLWSWLTESHSLTARLRQHCDADFGVQVLASEHATLTHDEQVWIGCDHGFVRDVHLCCGSTPWVRARTIATGEDSSRQWLQHLGDEPLGDWAFGQPSTRRSQLEVALLEDGLWARRSTLSVEAQPLYIMECFLDGATPWQPARD